MNEKVQMKPIKPGEQIVVDGKNAVPRHCFCGCKFFIPAVEVSILSALLSPTGQELLIQKPVLVCLECKAALGLEGGK